MDKILNSLIGIDWERIDEVERTASAALNAITRPQALSELLLNVADDPRLLGLSELAYWGDRIVLFDDPVSGVRVRLHRFNDTLDHPHSHRWGFTTRVLHGAYTNWLFGPESWVRSQVEQDRRMPSAALVRQEAAGAGYTIDDTMVHSVHVTSDTFSVIVRGPSVKERALRVRPSDATVYWQVGRELETKEKADSILTTEQRIHEVYELGRRVGVF